jgi:molecular chaperone HscA
MAKFAINLKEGNIEKESELIVGIDLGTTNSLVAYMKEGQAVAVKRPGREKYAGSLYHTFYR